MNLSSIGEKKLNAADRLKNFLDGIERYINGHNLNPSPFNPEFAIAETFSLEQLGRLTQDECFNYGLQLYQYADHVAREKAQCETVLMWCEHNLQGVIASEINSGDWGTYAKHETKVATILKENTFANKVNEWKMAAQGRIENLKSREYNIRRKAEILFEKGKRK
jgi:hypothetical protein